MFSNVTDVRSGGVAQTQGSSSELSGLLRNSSEAPRTPSGVDTPTFARLEKSLSEVVEGHRFFGLSAEAKTQLIVSFIPEDKLDSESLTRLMTAFDDHPEKMERLLHHKPWDCGWSANQRAANRALLLLEVATNGLDRALGLKESYKNLQPGERNNLLAAFSASEPNRESGTALLSFGDVGDDRPDVPDHQDWSPLLRSGISDGKSEEQLDVRKRSGSDPVRHSVVVGSKTTVQLFFEHGVPQSLVPVAVKSGLLLKMSAIHMTYEGKVATKDGEQSVIVKMFRGDLRDLTSLALGIDTPPRYELRNIATRRVARELQFDVVADCRIGVQTSDKGDETKLVLVMEKASGEPCTEVDPNAFASGKVQRELTKLQLLDALIGHGGRHGGTIYVDVDPDTREITVRGTDNDQCLGKIPTHPNDLADHGNTFKDSVVLPPVIDTDMAKAFDHMDADLLEGLIGDMVTAQELNAAKNRLAAIKDHIRQLQEDGKIIDPSKWGETIIEQVSPSNSYFARELMLTQIKPPPP